MNDHETTSAGPDTGVGPSALDRRRDKLQSTAAAKDAAAAEVAALDKELDSNADRHSGHEADLLATQDRVAGLKKSIKNSAKERGRLSTARKDAGRVAARAAQRATVAETRYDRAVLADMLRREKDLDLAAHSSAAGPATTGDGQDSDGKPQHSGAAGRATTNSAGTRPAAGTARTTAARATAARARSTTASPRTSRGAGPGANPGTSRVDA